jgi:hypothetical protein
MGWLFLDEAQALLHIDFGGRATIELLGGQVRYWIVWHRTAEIHSRWLRVHQRRMLDLEGRLRKPRCLRLGLGTGDNAEERSAP